MNCSLPVSSVHGIFQAKVVEWGAIAFSKLRPHMATNTLIFFKVDVPDSDAGAVFPLCDLATENTHCHFHHFILVTSGGLTLHLVTGEPPDCRRASKR